MIAIVIQAAGALIGAETLQMLGNERRKRLADYFRQISNLLAEHVKNSREGKESHGLCAKLAPFAERLRELASPALPGKEVDRLADALAEACKNWQKQTPSLADIEHAAEYFADEASNLGKNAR